VNKKYKDLVIATRNRKKKEEIVRLLGRLDDIKIWSLSDFPKIGPIEEDGFSFDENAVKKATIVADQTGMLALADDSGLEVDALGGRPGIYSSRYAGPDANDQMNNRKLLKDLAGVPFVKRNARYMCSVAIAEPQGKVKVVRGECYGIIGTSCLGNTGFGYDPLFIMPRFSKTVAQLGPKIKDRISHRAKAMHQARRIILRHVET
jgi:XTP/dITP diphosphohydrolase